ncbi:MAG: fused MFS/spermidine synthase [Planctomycetes bacterium]|nr:fused MFS/spermidine synthase [Planctomycetota bacterium]
MYLFAATIFLSAFLLFQVQPLIARYILPWFGGTPGVWSVTLVFFQTVLLAGYAYAHVLHTRFRPLTQLIVHLAILALAGALLPIIPPEGMKPDGADDPTLQILLLLGVTVGLPYFALSSTGPLLQAWFARRYRGRSPYALYALSNVGSLLALLSYPFLFESMWGRTEQAVNWSWGFGVFGVGCAGVAVMGFLASRQKETDARPTDAAPSPDQPEASKTEQAGGTTRRPLLWVLLPACATALLLSFTNHLTVDVASVPLLWVLPLSIYLLTFIITFAGDRWYPRRLFLVLGMLGAAGAAAFDIFHADLSVYVTISVLSAALFLLCMICHGEVYRHRPDPAKLTSFYLCVSLGGALGGISVAIVAPLVFPLHLEYPFAVLLTIACVLAAHAKDARSPLFDGKPRWVWASLLFLTLCVTGMFGYSLYSTTDQVIATKRNFYGVFLVKEAPEDSDLLWSRALVSGTTLHGQQVMEPGLQGFPTSYFGEHSGVGLTLKTFPRRPRRIAVLGLGVGTIAAYAEAGDTIRFYEINPVSVEYAKEYFFYLENCQADVEVVLGDARLVLEREDPQQFDILVVDVFSSDSIPVHLITTEAFAVYHRHLKPDGVIAVNISNRYLDLSPVIRTSAESLGFFYAGWISARTHGGLTQAAQWVIATRNTNFMNAFAEVLEQNRQEFPREAEGDDGHWPKNFGMPLDMEKQPDFRPWTDDYSNIFKVIK